MQGSFGLMNKILIITEGTHENIMIEALSHLFRDDVEIVQFPISRNIHAIKELNILVENAVDEEIDFINLFIEFASKNPQTHDLHAYRLLKPKDFSEIYLFFDLDDHDPSFDIELVKRVLEYFSNETEQGLLFLSYPMIEATVDVGLCAPCNKQCIIHVNDNKEYKFDVRRRSPLFYAVTTDHNRVKYILDHELVVKNTSNLLKEHFSRITCLTRSQYTFQEMKNIESLELLNLQCRLNSYRYSISGILHFFVNYHKEEYIRELIAKVKR